MGNEHNSAGLQRALRIWRRHAGERRLSVPPKGNTTIAGITFSGPIVKTHHENAIAAIWALVSDRDRKLGEVLYRVLFERGDLRGGFPALDVYADGLQSVGDLLGEVIALESSWEWHRLDQLEYTQRVTELVNVAIKMRPVSITLDWFTKMVHASEARMMGTVIADRVAAACGFADKHEHMGHILDLNPWMVMEPPSTKIDPDGAMHTLLLLYTTGQPVEGFDDSTVAPDSLVCEVSLDFYGFELEHGSVASISFRPGLRR